MCTSRYLLLGTCRFSFRTKTNPIRRVSIICTELDCVQSPRRKGISLSAEMRLDVRRTSRLMSLDPKPYIIKTGSLCKSPSVNKSPKTVSLTNSLAQFPRVLLKPRRIKAVRDRLDPKPFVTKTGSLCA